MKVLVLAPGFDCRRTDDGYSRHISEFSRALARVPDTDVIVLSLGGENRDEVFDGCRYRVLRQLRWFRIAPLIPILMLVLEMRRIGPDVIHLQGSAFDYFLICSLFLAPRSCRRCVTIHGHPAYEGAVNRRFRQGGLMYTLNVRGERALITRFDAIICVSECRKEEILSLRATSEETKVFLVPNGVDETTVSRCKSSDLNRMFRNRWSRAGPRIIQVKSLVPYSGQDVLIRAFGKVFAKVPGSRLVLVGEGWCRSALEDLTLRIGVRPSVDFLGRVENSAVPSIIRDCNVAVMPSNPIGGVEEGSSIALIEYVSCYVPVVASDVGGNRDTIVSGITGILVPPGDPASLATAILELWSDPQKSEQIATNAFDRVLENRTWTKIVGQYVEIYESLLDDL